MSLIGRRTAILALLVFLILLQSILARAEDNGSRFVVFAAASMKDVLEEVADNWPDAKKCKAIFSFAGSSALARQIEYGAPADLFVSANEAWMDYLEEKGKIRSDTRFDLAENKLVLIENIDKDGSGKALTLDDLKDAVGADRIAIALTDSVPAGIYARKALDTAGLWKDLQSNIVQTDNVRAALRLVAMGETRFGIVYRTDAAVEDRVRIVLRFPAKSHPRIVYPAALTSGGDNDCAAMFLNFIRSKAIQPFLVEYGYNLIDRPT
jgi:molybdate transport system substrate-binding protein